MNCNAIIAGRFCQVCGQENIETHETFGHLATHFISDIFHFDGQFFSTSKYLLFKPGFLTHEYVRGRRASYLNPIKMYFFVSAIFFLFFLSVYKPGVDAGETIPRKHTAAEVMQLLQKYKIESNASLRKGKLPEWARKKLTERLALMNNNIAALQKDTLRKEEIYTLITGPTLMGYERYRSVEEYDSLQRATLPGEKDNWLQRTVAHRNIALVEKLRKNPGESVNELLELFFHHFPQTLFISLPLFALILQLLYARRKQWFYANHIIYTIHLYCAMFIFIFVFMLLQKGQSVTYFGWLQYLMLALLGYVIYYTYQSMKVFYGQSAGKTAVKWMILNITALVVVILLFLLMFFFTIFTM